MDEEIRLVAIECMVKELINKVDVRNTNAIMNKPTALIIGGVTQKILGWTL